MRLHVSLDGGWYTDRQPSRISCSFSIINNCTHCRASQKKKGRRTCPNSCSWSLLNGFVTLSKGKAELQSRKAEKEQKLLPYESHGWFPEMLNCVRESEHTFHIVTWKQILNSITGICFFSRAIPGRWWRFALCWVFPLWLILVHYPCQIGFHTFCYLFWGFFCLRDDTKHCRLLYIG